MSQRATKEFTLAEFDDKHVWVELCEGEKRGLQFAVPLNNGCQEELNALEAGDDITATVKSLHDRKTAWKCVQVAEKPDDLRHCARADD